MDEIPYQSVSVIMFVMGLFATIVFSFANNKKELKLDDADIPGQLIKPTLSTIAFCVWAFTLGPPFNSLAWYHPFYGTLIMTFYTLVTPKIYEIIQILYPTKQKPNH